MALIQVYHNKRCTKSNQALNYLKNKGNTDNVEVILYLDNPINEETARQIVNSLVDDAALLIRRPDAKALGIDVPKNPDKEWIIRAITAYPKIMQRPVIVANGKAVIGRPAERIDIVV